MAATYIFDVFSSFDGFGRFTGAYRGKQDKQGPELLEHRLALYQAKQRIVFGANTYRAFAQMLTDSSAESEVRDAWVTRMRHLPTTVVSTTLEGPLDRPFSRSHSPRQLLLQRRVRRSQHSAAGSGWSASGAGLLSLLATLRV